MEHSSKTKPPVNPWLVILLTAPIPLILFVLFLFKWYQQRGDLDRVTQHFIDRQNKVLAYEATRVARRVSELLEASARDAQNLALLPPTVPAFEAFYRANRFRVTEYDAKTNAPRYEYLPAYNELSYLGSGGVEQIRIADGKPAKLRSLRTCKKVDLCDIDLWKESLNLKVGELHFGDLMRYYTPRNEQELDQGATFRVAYRAKSGVFIVGIDYRHWKEILHMPTFPYETRRRLLQAYFDGNYSYVVNDRFDIIAHPKHWHVRGIDRETQDYRIPVKGDVELGRKPVNVTKYQGEELKEYFNRLRNVSFRQRSVDVFHTQNLTGKTRVLSVAPIILEKGQFKDKGIFGYIITGCNVEYFKEPEEKLAPYF